MLSEDEFFQNLYFPKYRKTVVLIQLNFCVKSRAIKDYYRRKSLLMWHHQFDEWVREAAYSNIYVLQIISKKRAKLGFNPFKRTLILLHFLLSVKQGLR